MSRGLRIASILLIPSLSAAAPGQEGRDGGYDPVWSLGGHVGSMVLPGAYPLAFPPKINGYDFDDDGFRDDLDGDTVRDETTLERVRGDFLFGAEGFYWVSPSARIGLALDADLGTRFTHAQALILLDGTSDTGSVLVVYGGGTGFGKTTFRGVDADERLTIPNFPLRGEVGILLPATDGFGIEARLFGQMNVPSRHIYTDFTGNEHDVGGVPVSYLALGLQLGAAIGEYD